MSRIDFRLPALGADMESGTLTQWLKKPGERIHRGDALAVIETAKGLIDIEAFDEGVIEELLVQPGANVPVGAILARIASESQSASETGAKESSPGAAAPESRAADTAAAAQAVEADSRRMEMPASRRRISPAARRRAQELGLDLTAVVGSGPDGAVGIEDIDRLGKPAVPGAGGMRATIGAAMARSKREIPHYYLAHAIDFGPARDWLARVNASMPVAERLIEAVLLVKAVAIAVTEIEGFNGFFREGQFHPAGSVHVGTAIALRGGGVVAPALLDASHKDLKTLMREFSDLVTRVRAGRMRSSELTSATITVTSLGSEAVDTLFPIIDPPQVAIIGAGAVADRPWVSDGRLLVRPVLSLTLAADHRVTDGRAGARLLRRIADLLAQPSTL